MVGGLDLVSTGTTGRILLFLPRRVGFEGNLRLKVLPRLSGLFPLPARALLSLLQMARL